ncbi:hypothetical protein NPIL_308901 [Nephila pilipes]|uniref:Uncharacterized protein n=1 Tax=Nephila pilipes TaxID=299642 RepID=A0A8X6PF85_NEPPI|nr:hypothetical protein NPIL_308901 [Nephila pilipes]
MKKKREKRELLFIYPSNFIGSPVISTTLPNALLSSILHSPMLSEVAIIGRCFFFISSYLSIMEKLLIANPNFLPLHKRLMIISFEMELTFKNYLNMSFTVTEEIISAAKIMSLNSLILREERHSKA